MPINKCKCLCQYPPTASPELARKQMSALCSGSPLLPFFSFPPESRDPAPWQPSLCPLVVLLQQGWRPRLLPKPTGAGSLCGQAEGLP